MRKKRRPAAESAPVHNGRNFSTENRATPAKEHRAMTMTSRERFAAMLNHKTPDRMPVYPLVNSISRQSLGITYEEWTKDINKCAEAIIRTTDELELDCLCTLVDLSVEAADFGQELLYFTDKAACPDPAHRVVPTEGDYDKIPRIDPAKGKRMSEHVELCRKLVKARGKDKPVVAFVFGPWICIPLRTK